MIDTALEILREELNTFLCQKLNDPSPKVVFSPLVDEDELTGNGMMTMTLLSIEEERALRDPSPNVTIGNRTFVRNPDIRLNLYVMFTSFNKTHYEESLSRLSQTILFFQGKKVFTAENTPNLDENIESLFLDLHNLTTEQQNDLWGKFGVNYRPSVCYRIRLLTLQRNAISEDRPSIENIEAETNQIIE